MRNGLDTYWYSPCAGARTTWPRVVLTREEECREILQVAESQTKAQKISIKFSHLSKLILLAHYLLKTI